MFDPVKNPSPDQIKALIEASKFKALRQIIDCRNGDIWVWDFAAADHRSGANKLGVPYYLRPGEGDILTI